jgi:hypothetical protein
MFGLPRSISHAGKLAVLLRHMQMDDVAAQRNLLEDIAAGLLVDYAKRARDGLPVRMIDGSPMTEPDLRDAAYVVAWLTEPAHVERMVPRSMVDGYAARSEAWLRPVLDRYGLSWPWAGRRPIAMPERQVA